MLTYELRVLVVDVSAETAVQLNEATLIAEVTEAIHDLLQPMLLGDLIVQYLTDQHRVLAICRIPKSADPLDYILEFFHCILVVIHLSFPSWFPALAALLLSFP